MRGRGAAVLMAWHWWRAQYLVDQGIPTFGWNINAEWSTGANLFGEKGSFRCFTCPVIQPAFIARQERVAVFACGNAPQSLDCAEGFGPGFNGPLGVEGIEAAGQDFIQKKVVNATNKITDFTAGGILPPQDWTIVHGPATDELACAAYIHVENGEFVPVFGEPGKPFVCFEHNNEADLSGVPSIDDPAYV